MESVHRRHRVAESIRSSLVAFALSLGAGILSTPAWPLDLQVKDVAGNTIEVFNYLVNIDNTGLPLDADPSLHPGVHPMASYSPIVAAGDSTSATIVGVDGGSLPAGTCGVDGPDDDPLTNLPCRYLVSVRAIGYKLWGTHFSLTGSGDPTSILVELLPEPLPLSTLKVRVFHDFAPLNNAPDFPLETGSIDGSTPPATNMKVFHIEVEDVVGKVAVDFNGDSICGTGICLTDDRGEVTIPNLPFGKYEVFAIPPDGTDWVQSSTFEGKKSVGAWLEEGSAGVGFEFEIDREPGINTLHFFGFTRASDLPPLTTGSATITGRARNEQAWPPFELDVTQRFVGEPVRSPWVGLNDLDSDLLVALVRGNTGGNFTFNNVPPGTYQVVIWDEPQDYIIAFYTVIVEEGDTLVEMGDLGVFRWFGWVSGYVFNDSNCPVGSELTDTPGCGIKDPGEVGLPNIDVYLKFRDGTLDAGTFTNSTGYFEFPEALGPLFKFETLEVGFGRLERTGHSVQDEFSTNLPDLPTSPAPTFTWIPPDLGGGLILNQMTQQDRRSNVNFGKRPYVSGENGGIAGAVFYATTRNEFDARLALVEDYEPGIPDVPIRMWAKGGDGQLGTPDDVLINEIQTDHWDHPRPDNADLPQACDVKQADGLDFPDPAPGDPDTPADVAENCLEVPMAGNETKSGRWDGGWQVEDACSIKFDLPNDSPDAGPLDVVMGPMRTTVPSAADPLPAIPALPVGDGPSIDDIDDDGVPNGYDGDLLTDLATLDGASCATLPPADYIAQVVPPAFYQVVAEEDQNTDEGSDLVPLIPPPPCVGDLHYVNEPANPFNGQNRPLCDKRRVTLADKQNPGAEFFLFTDKDALPWTKAWLTDDSVPPPGRIFGLVLNDLVISSNLDSILLGEQEGGANLPVGLYDYAGRSMTTVRTDENGYYEVLLPSTFTAFCPIPSGICPGMYPLVVNDPGDPADPNEGYSNAFGPGHFVREVWPGKMTAADTPVLPLLTSECTIPPSFPHIFKVSQPYKDVAGVQSITITGTRFGASAPTVLLDNDDLPGAPIALSTSYTPGGGGTPEDVLTVDIPDTTVVPPGQYQLLVLNNTSGELSLNGLTFHVLGVGYDPNPTHVMPSTDPLARPLQVGIEAAGPGGLVIVHPGTYRENVVVHEQIILQGYGPGGLIGAPAPVGAPDPTEDTAFAHIEGTVIDGRFFQFSGDRSAAWQALVDGLVFGGPTPVPSGAAITVLVGDGEFDTPPFAGFEPRIDGFGIANALGLGGGGIHVHAFARNLRISNNVPEGNVGSHGAAISLGRPSAFGGLTNNENDDIRIHHNEIVNNGSPRFAGGLGIFNGADGYEVDHNFICGNFSGEYGGGVSHFGKSPGGSIHDNKIVNNDAFDEGGGVLVGGEQFPDLLGVGSGNVEITHNLIRGNLSNDDGGGIELLRPLNDEVKIVNNLIVNNLATDFGGGIVLDDASNAEIVNNTIARNKSTSTAEDARNRLVQGLVAGAGIVSEKHSAQFLDYLESQSLPTAPGFSNPVMFNNIVWDNQACKLDGDAFDCSEVIDFEIFAVSNGVFNPNYTVMTEPYGGGLNNFVGDPTFVDADDTILILGPGREGIGFLNVTIDRTGDKLFGFSDYHLQDGSLGIDAGAALFAGVAAPPDDFDHDVRPQEGGFDIGADETEFSVPPPPPIALLYFSTASSTAVPGVCTVTPTNTCDDADIYLFHSNETFTRVFDASVAGLPAGADVDAMKVVDDDTFYLSFNTDGGTAVPTLGTVQDEDIVKYDAGTWSMYFDGSDVALATNSGEDVDAFDVLSDGSVIISTVGDVVVPSQTTRRDEDMLRCVGTFGPTTTCTWSWYFDGSDVGLGNANSEDVDGVTVFGSGATKSVVLSTLGAYTVPGLSGGGDDIIVCRSATTGGNTVCTAGYSRFFDGSAHGITDNIDAFQSVVDPVTGASLAAAAVK